MTAMEDTGTASAVSLPGSRYLYVLDAEARAVAACTGDDQPGVRVPGAPGLTPAEVARHLGSTYRATEAWLREGKRPATWQREPAAGESLEDYLLAGLMAVTGCLASEPANTPAPGWYPEAETYGFWLRRMCHETTIHRIDVQQARGAVVSVVDDDVATDGVDEILHVWFGHRARTMGLSGTREGAVLVRTAGRTWRADSGPRGTAVRRITDDHPHVDATVSGDPMQLYLWLWGRASIHQADASGDQDAVAQLWALLRLATR
jgi:uncharacterized protein (TIGR03083 family)